MTKTCRSRKYTHTIMAGAGTWSGVTLFTKDGIVAEIPTSCLLKDGTIKDNVADKLHEFTRENATALEEKGVELYVEGRA